jgi:hypothetical protein
VLLEEESLLLACIIFVSQECVAQEGQRSVELLQWHILKYLVSACKKMSQEIDLQCPRFGYDPSLQSQFLWDIALPLPWIGIAVFQNEELSLSDSRKRGGSGESDQSLVSRLSLIRNSAEMP